MTEKNIPPPGRVALVHDWLTGMRGGEKVLEEIASFYPDAEIFTVLHIPGSVSGKLERHRIHESFIGRLPAARKKYRNYLPFFPTAIERFDLTAFDLAISISHCVAKGAITPPDTPHLCYINTPMRYAYDQFYNYFPQDKTGKMKHLIISHLMTKLRTWDQATQARVDRFAANSNFVAKRVKKYYGRTADVIHPPVDLNFYTPDDRTREDFYLIVSALEPYKKIDIAIEAFKSNGKRLLIAGTGSMYKTLKRNASGNIEFLGRLSNDEIRSLYRRARAFILPGTEDFGITPVEAQGCGTPVVALAAGGALETVINAKTGILFNESSPTALSDAIDKMEKIDFNSMELRKQSMKFSRERFREKFSNFVKNALV